MTVKRTQPGGLDWTRRPFTVKRGQTAPPRKQGARECARRVRQALCRLPLTRAE